MGRITGVNIDQELLDALKLPKHTVWFSLTCSMDGPLMIECEYLPDLDQGELTRVVKTYELWEGDDECKGS